MSPRRPEENARETKEDMPRGARIRLIASAAIVLLVVIVGIAAILQSIHRDAVLLPDKVLAAYDAAGALDELTVDYPSNETLFPPEIVAPTFRWSDGNPEADAWVVRIEHRFGRIESGSSDWRGGITEHQP